jgi:hypothetical protein
MHGVVDDVSWPVLRQSIDPKSINQRVAKWITRPVTEPRRQGGRRRAEQEVGGFG